MAMSATPGSYEGEPPNAAGADTQSGEPTKPVEATGSTAEATDPSDPDAQPPPGTSTPTDTATSVDGAAREQALTEALDQPEVLPCGQALDELWERWTEAPAAADNDPHLSTCPHCTAALDELRLLDEFVRQQVERDEREAARTPLADTGRITERVMDIVRTELRPGASVPLGEPDEDHWITETAAARTFRNAAEREAGVQAGSCRIAPVEGPERRFAMPGARLPRVPIRVSLGIVAPLRLHTPVPEIASRVRDLVSTAAKEELGMEVRAVDVVVIDLSDEAEEGTA